MKLYLGPVSHLNGARSYTNLTELWLDDPAARRLMRRAGIEEAVVTGAAGDYALLCSYLTALATDHKALSRARNVLAILGYEALLDAPEALWTRCAEDLASGALDVRALLAHAAPIHAAIPIWEQPACAPARPVIDLGALFTCTTGLRSAIEALEQIGGEPITGIRALLALLSQQIAAFADAGCDSLLLTVTDRLPACLRADEAELDRLLTVACRRDGHGLQDGERDALRARLLFGILPLLRAHGMTLIVRGGAIEWGDGRLPCGFDAPSLASILDRLGKQMPQVLLCPRSPLAEPSMRALTGIFPAIDGKPAIAIAPRHTICEAISPLPLLAPHRR